MYSNPGQVHVFGMDLELHFSNFMVSIALEMHCGMFLYCKRCDQQGFTNNLRHFRIETQGDAAKYSSEVFEERSKRFFKQNCLFAFTRSFKFA